MLRGYCQIDTLVVKLGAASFRRIPPSFLRQISSEESLKAHDAKQRCHSRLPAGVAISPTTGSSACSRMYCAHSATCSAFQLVALPPNGSRDSSRSSCSAFGKSACCTSRRDSVPPHAIMNSVHPQLFPPLQQVESREPPLLVPRQ